MSRLDQARSRGDAVVDGRLSRRDFIRRASALGLSAPAIAIILAACGGTSPTSTTAPAATTAASAAATAASAAPTTAPAAAAAASSAAPAAPSTAPAAAASSAPGGSQPKSGGTSVWASDADPVSLDPIKNPNFSSTLGFEHCYESLTGYDSKQNIVPALAERWELPDDTTYIFHLRNGVKWHDGTDFTAEDVKYTFDIVKDQNGPAGWKANFSLVDKIDIVDKSTVKFTTTAPFPPLLGAFAILRSSGVIQKGAMEKGKLDTVAVGTGPYKLVEYVPKDHIKLVKNKEYWGAPLPYIDDVTFKILEDEDARVAALRSGSVDYTVVSPEGQQRLKGEKAFTISSIPRMYNYDIVFNPKRQPWWDPRVRQAIGLAIDRQEINDKVYSGALTIGGPIPSALGGDWNLPADEISGKWYKQDPDKAKQLLKDAGVTASQVLDMPVTAWNPNFPALAVVLADQLKKVGIAVKVRQLEAGVYIDDTDKGNYDLTLDADTARHDPDGYVYRLHSSQLEGYKNAQLDDLLVKGRTTIDVAQRKQIYLDVQRLLLTDLPNIWIGVDTITEALQGYVKGYTQSSTSRRFGLKNTWLDR